jgi:hypothetical protein
VMGVLGLLLCEGDERRQQQSCEFH